MNKAFLEEYKKQGMMILSKQPNMSLEEMREQAIKQKNFLRQNGNPSPNQNSETPEKENPQT